jgi:hypothetical protein
MPSISKYADYVAQRFIRVGRKLFLIDHTTGEIARRDRRTRRRQRDSERDRTSSSQLEHCWSAASGRLPFPDLFDQTFSFEVFDDRRDRGALQIGFACDLGARDGFAFAHVVQDDLPVDIADRVEPGRLGLSEIESSQNFKLRLEFKL